MENPPLLRFQLWWQHTGFLLAGNSLSDFLDESDTRFPLESSLPTHIPIPLYVEMLLPHECAKSNPCKSLG